MKGAAMSRCLRLCGFFFSMTLLAAFSQSQESRPALGQCRLDIAAYKSLGNFAHPTATDLQAQTDYMKRFPLSEISRQTKEMEDCMEVDKENHKDYEDVSLLLASAENNRYMNFLSRHDLWKQFVAEDSQGKR
jgi:hypothetical protein